ncbi:MAG: type II toxin-antitoxin system PemK/MazF family toxin [Burkholderiales bacterium]
MQGSDTWLASPNPTLGSEVQKSRSCVVNSPPETNEHLRTVVVASMTTGSWPAPFRIPVTSQRKNGLVLLDQLRALDRQRQVERLGSVKPATLDDTLGALQVMFAH